MLKEINGNKKLIIKEEDIQIIPEGKYQNLRNEKELDHEDPFIRFYWDFIQEILIKFISAKKITTKQKIVIWIRFLFDIFKNE